MDDTTPRSFTLSKSPIRKWHHTLCEASTMIVLSCRENHEVVREVFRRHGGAARYRDTVVPSYISPSSCLLVSAGGVLSSAKFNCSPHLLSCLPSLHQEY